MSNAKIISLTSTNVKRLRAVQITPDADGNLVVISGNNGEGKSSVLHSIALALGGVNSKGLPRPIRDGEKNAEIVLETEDITVIRRFTASGSTLVVKSKDGAVYPKGQAKLDDLLGKLSLDPMAFTLMEDKKQLETLLSLVDLPFDPAELEAERKQLFETRAGANRAVKELTAQAQQYTGHPADLPAEEVSVSELLTQHQEGETANYELRKANKAVEGWKGAIERIKRELADAERQLADAEAYVASAPAPVDLEAIHAQINNAESTNREVRRKQEGDRIKARLADAKALADGLTADLKTLEDQKAAGLADAVFPGGLPLGFEDGVVTLNGVPFKQASSAEQIRTSTAMAMALSPKLRVILISDGSLLDKNHLAIIEEMAAANDFQIWIEMVGPQDDSWVIEDGSVLTS